MSIAVKPDRRYRVLLTALRPFLIWHTISLARRVNDARFTRQKLGKDIPQRNDRPVWIHMASVGEVNAAYPLVLELQRQYPELPVVVTTFTPTGAETAIKKFGAEIEHIYLPLDFSQSIENFFHQLRPRCALIMETEIWPWLFYHCKLSDIPLLMINGRLSKRTMNKPDWIRRIYGSALQNVDQVLARSDHDAQQFVTLGADASKIQIIDNLKFAAIAAADIPTDPIHLPRPYILAASTHNDEELQISRAWLDSGLSHTHLLVIVPRHPKRKKQILQQLQPLTSELTVRSENAVVTETTLIYLADTFGELQQFITGAELVCVGGSFIPHGGQNVIEVARHGKLALFGPHMDNFADERDLLLAEQAAVEVNSIEELIEKITQLLNLPEDCKTMGNHARQLVENKADVIQRYIAALNSYLA